MATLYWIKLYTEILDDPKVAMMPDYLWRRMIELFLLAGRLGKGGALPDSKQIAWALRAKESKVEADLEMLSNEGIVRRTNDGWVVVNFEKRQAPSPDTIRKQQQRERSKRDRYGHEDVTNCDGQCDTECHEDVTKRDAEQNRTEPEPEKNRTEPEPEQSDGGGGGGLGHADRMEMLHNHGIRGRALRELSVLTHVTEELVIYHLRDAPNIGAAIVRIRENWPVPGAVKSEYDDFVER